LVLELLDALTAFRYRVPQKLPSACYQGLQLGILGSTEISTYKQN